MAAIILGGRWMVQPPYPIELDRSHPLAKGLAGVWLPRYGTFRDVFTSPGSTLNNGALTNAIVGTTSGGPSIIYDGSGDYVTVSGITANPIPANGQTIGVLANITNVSATRCLFSAREGTGWTLAVNTSRTLRYFAEGLTWQDGPTNCPVGRWALYGVSDRAATNSTSLYADKQVVSGKATSGPSSSYPLRFGLWDTTGTPAGPFLGAQSLAFIFRPAITDAHWAALAENPWQIFRPNPVIRRVWMPGVSGGATTHSGSGAATLPLVTASGTGKRALKSTGATALPLLTASGAGKKARAGTGAANLPLVTASGTGKKARSGTGAATLPLITAGGSGTSAALSEGSGAATLPLITASGAGTKARKGTGAATLPLLAASGAGTKARKGSGTPSLPLLTASGAGKKARAGSGSATLPLLTASGAGDSASEGQGAGAATLPLLTASGTGSRALKSTGDASLPVLTASGTGKRALKSTGAATLPVLTASGTGALVRTFLGSGALSLPIVVVAGAGAGGESIGRTVDIFHTTVPVAPNKVGATEWAEGHTIFDGSLPISATDGLQAALNAKLNSDLSGLSAASSVSLSDIVIVSQSGVLKTATVQQIKDALA